MRWMTIGFLGLLAGGCTQEGTVQGTTGGAGAQMDAGRRMDGGAAGVGVAGHGGSAGASGAAGAGGGTAGAGGGAAGAGGGTAGAGGGGAGMAGAGGRGGAGASGGAGSAGAAGTGGTAGAGAAGTGGTAGAGGAAGSAGTPAGGFGGAPVDRPDTIEVGVRNLCPFPLYVRAAGASGVLAPEGAQIAQGQVRWYDAPKEWPAARVTAYLDAARTQEIDKVEVTLGSGVINYNVTYVDWVGLPMRMESTGTGADCRPVSCDVPVAQLTTGCPDGLLDGQRCVSARTHCLDPRHAAEPYCHKLDDEVRRCATTKPGCEGAAGATTAEAYACSGFFSGSPKWCAALNRGMLDAPDDPDKSHYYQREPHDTYAKWVHQRCPGVYAFAYDDYPSNAEESGFHACTGGRELRITFCPAG